LLKKKIHKHGATLKICDFKFNLNLERQNFMILAHLKLEMVSLYFHGPFNALSNVRHIN